MIKSVKKLLNSNNKGQQSNYSNDQKKNNNVYMENQLEGMKISNSLNENIGMVKNILGSNADLVIRNITLGRSKDRPAAILYIDNLINSQYIDANIIRPLVLDSYTSGLNTGSDMVEQLQAGNLIAIGQMTVAKNFSELLDGVLAGDAGLLIDEVNEAYVISVKGYAHRTVSESDVEPIVRGPREAFIEVLSINLGLIRRRLQTPNLVFEQFKIGTVGKTNVCLAFIRGICPDELLDEVRSRLKRIKIDGVLESGYIEEFIQDNPYSPFPQIRSTERPDVVAAALLEGRAAIIVDNTPVALVVPGEFFSLMQAAEDYYNRYTFSSLIRLLRYFSFFISIFLPALYIAVTDYHQEMIPTALLASIISARAEVPIPVFIEAFAMILTFEILHEAGVRLPRPIGQAVSIVGALVIGQSAVQAKLVSPLMVIVVALTAIAKFCTAQYNVSLTIRILRPLFMVLASILGMFGIMIGTLFMMLHLFSLESFGKPYMAPLSPLRTSDLKDTFVRAPWWAFIRRPAYGSPNSKRMKPGQVPHPPENEGDKS